MKKVLTFLLVFALGFTLASCTNQEDVTNVEDAAKKLSLEVSDPTAVTSDIVLPTTGLHESTISWASDNEAVIATDGKVTRPAVGSDDATVKLTATLTVGKETATKEFTFKVLAAVPSAAVTIAELESSAVAKGDVVEITGVVVGIINTYGFQVYDGTGFSYAVEFAQPTVSLGDNVTVLGEKDVYNGGVQVSEIQSIVVNSTGNDLPAFTATTLTDIFAEDNESTTWYNDMLKATAYVAIQGEHSNAYLTWFDADLDLIQMEVYYKSGGQDQIGEVKALDGKLADVEFILKDFAYGSYRVTVNTNSTITENTTITDADKAKLAVAFNDLNFKGLGDEIVADLNLPTKSDVVMDGDTGAALVWTSSKEATIATDGEVTLPSGNTETVTLTVTATVGTETASKTYTFVVADKDALTVSTVTEALAMEDGTVALVEGIVSGMRYGRPFIQDADGTAMFVYSKVDVKVGDKVKLFGKIDTFDLFGNDMIQLTDAVLMATVSSDNAVVFNTTLTPAELAQNITDYHAQGFTMTLKWLSTDTSNGYYFFEGYVDAADNTNNVRIKMDTDWFPTLETYLDDSDQIQVTFLQYDVHFDEARIVPVAFPGLTSAQVLDIVKAMIDVAATDVTADLKLVTEVELFDAVITWTSTNTAVAIDGTVTRPTAGEADATGNVTASIVIGTDAAVVVDHAVTVLAEDPTPVSPDLMFSEYIEGSSNNKAIEIYNPTDASLDLTGYAINYYNNGATDPTKTFDLTGITLAAGETYVICTDTYTNQADCDEVQLYADADAVVFYNGNDALEITKNGTSIDVLGVIGNDADFAKDVTMRRKETVYIPNTTYTVGEWDVLAQDTFDGLGAHSHTDLMFSEYIEGSSNNKAIEIYNPTSGSLDLTGYVINYYNNGATEPTKTFDLTGITLAAGETYVICTDTYTNQADCDEVQVYADADAVVFYNGNDVLEIAKDGRTVDILGVIGSDADFAKDVTMRRKGTIKKPNSTYTVAEWDVLAQDTFDGLGAHTIS